MRVYCVCRLGGSEALELEPDELDSAWLGNENGRADTGVKGGVDVDVDAEGDSGETGPSEKDAMFGSIDGAWTRRSSFQMAR
jgi:hypothetical protein